MSDETQSEVDKTNEKKQNDILARREARRKRILENAISRLEKLSGPDKETTNKCMNNSTETYSDPEIEHPEYILSPTYSTTSSSNNVDWGSSPLLNSPTVVPPTKFEKILSSRIHIMVASGFSYSLLIFGLNAILSQSLFALFLALECIELVFFRQDRPLSPIVSMVLMMSGIHIGKAGAFIKICGLLNKMLCDLGLFVFCFVLSHGFYCVFVGGTIDESFYSF